MYGTIIACFLLFGYVEPDHETKPGTNWDKSYRDYETVVMQEVSSGDDFHLTCGDYIDDRIGMDC